MKDIKELLQGAVDKIKSTVEKQDIPLAEAYAQMEAELDEAEKAYGEPFFPTTDENISIDEHYLKVLGFNNVTPNFEEIKAHYEALINKFNPENFAEDEEKYQKALKRTDLIKKAYNYFEEKYSESEQE